MTVPAYIYGRKNGRPAAGVPPGLKSPAQRLKPFDWSEKMSGIAGG